MRVNFCDTKLVMFTLIFCKNLNMTSVEVDKETCSWIGKNYLKWLSKNEGIVGYENCEESMINFTESCFK